MDSFFSHAVELGQQAITIFFHLDVHLAEWANVFGAWIYAILFAIIFCETGLVVTPILPGDSLLFAAGALASLSGSPLRIGWTIALLITAGVLGDSVNYAVGRRLGPKVFRSSSRLLNQRHLQRAHEFYERHGGKTIIIAQYMPIIRTFAPFVAGIGQMRYGRFFAFNVIGVSTWVTFFTAAGYLFGNIPGIIAVSLTPFVTELVRAHRRARREAREARAALVAVGDSTERTS